MYKFCFFITLAVAVAMSQLVPYIITLAVNITQDLQSIELGEVGDAGYIAIPFETVCRVPVLDTVVGCALCNQDCIFGHNAFGGKCGPNPLVAGGTVCACAYTQAEADAMNVSVSTRDTCSYDIVPPALIFVQDVIFKEVITRRAQILQCASVGLNGLLGYTTTTACYTDCSVNHGRSGGTCRIKSPRAPGSGLLPALYCECI